jgi:hypothetical protein
LGHRLKIMPITINGSGTVTGISAGGLPDDCIVTADIADNNVTTPKVSDANYSKLAKRSEQLTTGHVQASTSRSSIDFTGIPSWVKRVTVMFNGVSTNGTSVLLLQVGAGSVVTSGYLGSSVNMGNATSPTVSLRASGFGLDLAENAAAVRHGAGVISLLGSNTYVFSSVITRSDIAGAGMGGGSVALSGALDRVRLTTVNGTDTFDAGLVNIMYE